MYGGDHHVCPFLDRFEFSIYFARGGTARAAGGWTAGTVARFSVKLCYLPLLVRELTVCKAHNLRIPAGMFRALASYFPPLHRSPPRRPSHILFAESPTQRALTG